MFPVLVKMVMGMKRRVAANNDYRRRLDGGIRRRGKGKPERKEEEAVAALPTSFRFADAAVDGYGRRSVPNGGI
ncbi:hypothetical protein ACLOJK_035308 [Asimina triloba]